MLAAEERMFDMFLGRVESKIDHPVDSDGGESASASPVVTAASSLAVFGSVARRRSSAAASGRRRSTRLRQLSSSVGGGVTPSLTAEQKCEVAEREIDEFAAKIRAANEHAETQLGLLKVSTLQKADAAVVQFTFFVT